MHSGKPSSSKTTHQSIWWELRELGMYPFALPPCSAWRESVRITDNQNIPEYLWAPCRWRLNAALHLVTAFQPPATAALLLSPGHRCSIQISVWSLENRENHGREFTGKAQDLAQPFGHTSLSLWEWLLPGSAYVGSWFHGCVSIACPDLKCKE